MTNLFNTWEYFMDSGVKKIIQKCKSLHMPEYEIVDLEC